MFLTLNTNQANCLKSRNELIWTLPNLDLSCFTSVGISGITVSFGGSRDHQLVPITSSIIDKNYLNPSGIIYIIPGTNDFAQHSGSFEKWPLDSATPHYISFTFNNSTVNIEFCQITLRFTDDAT